MHSKFEWKERVNQNIRTENIGNKLKIKQYRYVFNRCKIFNTKFTPILIIE